VTSFEPIAIVGQSCVLPGATDPDALWQAVIAGQDLTSSAAPGYWQLPAETVRGSGADQTWSDRGGYVSGFDKQFDPDGFAIPAELIEGLDPLFQWTLQAARGALRSADIQTIPPGSGLVMGNLAYPTPALTRYAASVWLDEAQAKQAGIAPVDPHNRFCSGWPAHLTAQALGFDGRAFALDAACASSLYAIKLACDQLQDRRADLMLAGAVNHADDLFIHVGFCALQAMSRSGRSRPFDQGADGLVPGEGAAFVLLERLSDARAKGRKILGVIRGVGLSNDGKSGGFLAPAEEGQLRAMRAAYEMAGLSPSSVSLLECHATGTPVGDAVELRSAATVFAESSDLPLGSLKANMGHLISVAGAAGLIKLLGAIEQQVRPPNRAVEAPLAELSGGPLRLLQSAEDWAGPRRAALSAFGFGGNNAHLIVEAEDLQSSSTTIPVPQPSTPDGTVAIVAIEMQTGDDGGQLDEILLEADGLRFPPIDLQQTLPQQLLILALARKAAARITLPSATTAVLIGMGCDPEIARYAARWRLPDWAKHWDAPAEWVAQAQEAFTPGLQAAGVVGTMPNIPANRINAQLDLAGPSFTVAAEQLSGVRALELAERALRHQEIDAALVGAVDLSHEPVHRAAARSVLGQDAPTDAAVLLVLKRVSDAWRDGDPILATLTEGGDVVWPGKPSQAHVASGLLQVAEACLGLHETVRLEAEEQTVRLELDAMGQQRAVIGLRQGPDRSRLPGPGLWAYSGNDCDEVLQALTDDCRGLEAGPARLVLTRRDAATIEIAGKFLRNDPGPAFRKIAPGIFWAGQPVAGELAFAFTGAAAAYPGMGRDLLRVFPELGHETTARFSTLLEAEAWLDPEQSELQDDPFAVLLGCTLLSQIHAELTRELLGLRPAAVLGVSSGETNSMFATGAWRDLDGLFNGIAESGMYEIQISGECQAARNAWGDDCPDPLDWRCWRLLIDAETVAAAVEHEPFVRLTMINAPADCVIAGQAEDCRRVIESLGRSKALPMGHDIVAHCTELATWRDEWWALHHRATQADPDVRYYSNALGTHYLPTAESVADALTDQQTDRVDFRRVVEAAWQDGVRIFVEHGPRALCTGWIGQILGDREHLALALDRPGDPLGQLVETVAVLVAAGVPVDTSKLFEAAPDEPLKPLRFAAHAPPIVLPALRSAADDGPQLMAAAPWLPPVIAAQTAAPAAAQTVAPAAAQIPQRVAPTAPALPAAPRKTNIQPALASEPRAAIAVKMRAFHQQVAGAHQLFLSQQERAIQQMLQLRTAEPAPGSPTPPPAAPKPTPTRPAAPRAQPSAPPATPKPAVLPGPRFDRKQLEVLASGKISQVLGEMFRKQDDFHRQVRMPKPPLLLADRVTGIDGEPGSMGKGTIWTETDIVPDAWYLHHGRMPAGIMIESGQADLLLISWLGVDFTNRGERVYRLLGCELTYHGSLPQIGDTLQYEIHLDGYAQQGPVQLMFFHYDCRVNGELKLSVTGGQAGFFTDEELAGSAGILWDPQTADHREEVRLDPPTLTGPHSAFSKRQVRAFSEGRVADCFGPEFRAASCHVRTPRIQHGRMLLFDEVTQFDPTGGPWQRGYLRAEDQLTRDEWFFDGHFMNDPCMPGTLMLEGCLQTMAFYMAAMGFTVKRDGWRFEPVDEEGYKLRCRGQVIPGAKTLVYEVFVEEVIDGPIPTLIADLLCTVDGLPAFHCRAMQLRLTPGFPLESRASLVPHRGDPVTGYHSLASCAWGKPSDAFGPMYEIYDTTRRCPRLPGAPYHFVSRVTVLDAVTETAKSGGKVEVEYDIPPDAWYFAENGNRTMPYCVLLEAALQPCGWLASFIGCALSGDDDVFFRNLDGTATQHLEVLPDAGILTTHVSSTGVAKAGSMTIVNFEVECYIGEALVFEMKTVFGFFPEAALASQVGMPANNEEIARLALPSDFQLDLRRRPAKYFAGELRLPGPMLMMLHRITGCWPEQGRLRAEIDVDHDQWFFKCHFMGDPVQPGSLGIEAMLQLLQFHMLHAGLHEGIERPRFEAIQLATPMTWKYRGQVMPHNSRVVVELQIEKQGAHEASGKAWLWVDGMRIYEAVEIGMRVVEDRVGLRAGEDERLDPAQDRWLEDHCPTWTVPALAMMSMIDRLAAAGLSRAPGRVVTGMRNVRVHRWLGFADGAQNLKVLGVPRGPDRVETELLVWDEASETYEVVASGDVIVGENHPLGPRPTAPATGAIPQPDPYEAGVLFHGPAYQALKQLAQAEQGATSLLDADPGTVPLGALNQRLLDAATHGIPHDNLHGWTDDVGPEMVAYPVMIPSANFYRPTPTEGEVRCEARFAGFHGGKQFPRIELTLIHQEEVWAEITLIESLFPKGPLGMPAPHLRRAFLGQRAYVPGLGLAHRELDATVLDPATVEGSDWLAGSLAHAYAATGEDLTREIAIKEHVAALARTHPAWVRVGPESGEQVQLDCRSTPLNRYVVHATQSDDSWRVTGQMSPTLELESTQAYWREMLGTQGWLGEDMLLGLVRRFVRSLILSDPDAIDALRGRGVVFLANHQVGVESVLFSLLSSALLGLPTPVLAKQEHRDSWIGRMLHHLFDRPEIDDPGLLALVDRDDTQQMLASMSELFARVADGSQSLLMHVEGTRAVQCRVPLSVVSTTAIDLAVKSGTAIVPVRFSGGLPIDPLEQRVEFPIGFGKQDFWIGAPLEGLAPLPSAERKTRVLEALNALGGPLDHESPHPADEPFSQRVAARGIAQTQAVLAEVLSETSTPCEETIQLLRDGLPEGWMQ